MLEKRRKVLIVDDEYRIGMLIVFNKHRCIFQRGETSWAQAERVKSHNMAGGYLKINN